MRGAVIYGKGDVRFEEREDPRIVEPSDAVVRTVATCVCGSDLWRYRGINEVPEPTPIGHEYVGVVDEVGDAVKGVKPGDFVVGGFRTSDNTCPLCRKGSHGNCLNGGRYDGCQAEKIRVPNADGTLVAVPGEVDRDLIPSLLALSDVAATGWHGAVSALAGPGKSIAVVGDGAVGLCAVLAAKQLGSEQVIAMSRHADRQEIAREFGADVIVSERGEEGAARVRELTEGVGADGVVEAVGTSSARDQAALCVRSGGMIGAVGLPHGGLQDDGLFFRNVGTWGGIAPVRYYLEDLIKLVVDRKINPGRVFDLQLPLADVAEAYAAMDERRATKVLLWP